MNVVRIVGSMGAARSINCIEYLIILAKKVYLLL